MIVTIIGVGLIGGSMALDLKSRGFATRIIGVDKDKQNAMDAINLGIVDELMKLDEAIAVSDIIIISIPVKASTNMLPYILDRVKPTTMVTDVGSTKKNSCDAVKDHKNRKQYVAFHPIAGTENFGAKAALKSLFDTKVGIVCEENLSSRKAVRLAEKMFKTLNMKLLFMDADAHDMHVAYVSHMPHVISYVLAETVLEVEKSTATIFNLAGSGFGSTARLGKSPASMWVPIFEQNSEHISKALDIYIKNLQRFKNSIDKKDTATMQKDITSANKIRAVLEGIKVKI
jgi:prephenate dehydrogenase